MITELAGKRKHGFALERAVFLTVLHRLFVSGSDRAASRWREDYAIVGIEGLDLHHLYRAMAWLGEGTAGEGTGWPHAIRAALSEGRGGGAAVRVSARPADAARPGVHGHHQSVLRGRWRADAGPARLPSRIIDRTCGR